MWKNVNWDKRKFGKIEEEENGKKGKLGKRKHREKVNWENGKGEKEKT